MGFVTHAKTLHCAYLRARAALHRIGHMPLASERALVRVTPVPEDPTLDEVWSIDCTPGRGVIMPKFSARFWVQYREDGGADLEMIAQCAPRGGILTRGFDAVLGRILASKTCRGVLQELAERIERQCAATN